MCSLSPRIAHSQFFGFRILITVDIVALILPCIVVASRLSVGRGIVLIEPCNCS